MKKIDISPSGQYQIQGQHYSESDRRWFVPVEFANRTLSFNGARVALADKRKKMEGAIVGWIYRIVAKEHERHTKD